MIASLRKFFAFCSAKNRKLFYQSLVLGLIIAVCESMKFIAIGLILLNFFQASISYSAILASLGIILTSVLLETVVRAKSTMLQCIGGYDECANKRIEIAEHLRFIPMGYFNETSIGEITSVTTNIMEALGDIATRVVMLTTQGILNTAVIIGLIVIFDWRIGLITLAGVLLFAIVNHSMQKANQKISDQKMAYDTNLVAGILEYVQGIGEVKAYKLTGSARRKLNDTIENTVQTNIELELAANRFIPLQSIILKLTGVAMTLAAIAFYLANSMDLVTAIVMMILAFHVFSGLESMSSYSVLLRLVDLYVTRGQDILLLPAMDISGTYIKTENQDIELKDVSFAYEQRKIIDSVTLSIPKKTSAAFVGPSGAGKTTLCQLIARFWDVHQGEVMLAHRNVQEYSLDALMENFSFVFQNVYLFHDTIANNIRFGQPDAPMEKVVEAARKACCHEFIQNLPQGYDTVIGEKGGTLSGGERQRVSIARAMMKDAPVIILDEATANVDPENEKDLIDAISALTSDKTVIMIAHRLKTVQSADQIFVVDKGRIVQAGKHADLLAETGIYQNFVEARRQAIGWKIS